MFKIKAFVLMLASAPLFALGQIHETPQVAPQQPIARSGSPTMEAQSNVVPISSLQSNQANDAARCLAGLPISSDSSLTTLTQDRRWAAHARAMDLAFAQLEQRKLNHIRVFRSENFVPTTQLGKPCVYLFSGPDFLYADTIFSECSTFVLQGLEPLAPLPDLTSIPPTAFFSALHNIQVSLNTVLSFTFFRTEDMQKDFERSEMKGVLPIIFVFMARTGKQIQEVEYVSLDKDGKIIDGFQGKIRGAKIVFSEPPLLGTKTLFYFSCDLSDNAIRRNPAILRFCASLGPANSLLKAASYLLHDDEFSIVRDHLLQNSSLILEDDSGIPIHYFTLDKWTLRFFGTYEGPIDSFKHCYQSDLRRDYEIGNPKPLTFGFGYRWNDLNSTLILATRND